MKLVIAALCGSLVLTGCASKNGTADLTKIDATISSQNVQTAIQFSCIALSGAEAGWSAWVSGHKVSDANLQAANAAMAAVSTACTPPYPQNTADVVAKVVAATVSVITALKSETGTAAAAS